MPRISNIMQSVDIFIQREVNPKMCSYTVQFILQCLITTPRLELKSFFIIKARHSKEVSQSTQEVYKGHLKSTSKKSKGLKLKSIDNNQVAKRTWIFFFLIFNILYKGKIL